MTGTGIWRRLDHELSAWQQEGLTASFWWRDDDAADAYPALERLLDLRRQYGTPLALAIIPAEATEALAQVIRSEAGVCALQHGYLHRNHAPAGMKKSEFPPQRPADECLSDLSDGMRRMQALFDDQFVPVIVPPWNRIAPALVPHLGRAGFTAVSAFKPRDGYWAAPGLVNLSTHIDPVDWHGKDVAGAQAAALQQACGLLERMRLQRAAPEPVGLLSHHLRHDASGWDFLAELLGRTAGHPAVRWISARNALEIGKPRTSVMPTS